MRKFTFAVLALCLLGMNTQVTKAQATRNLVVLEIFTGTWCQFCPGAAMGADDLIANGKKVAVLEHHTGDAYEIPETVARDAYYGVTGYPTSVFDGEDSNLGGSTNSSIYTAYLPIYNQKIAQPTPFGISLTKTDNGAGNFDVSVTVDQMGAYAAGNLVLHLMVTQSHIAVNWFGLSEIDYVTRDMNPDQNGTPITLTQGNQVTQPYNFTLGGTWVQADCEVIAFLQNSVTKEVFNGAKLTLATAQGANDPVAVGFATELAASICDNSVAPEITIRNDGGDDLTSLDIEYSVNGGTPSIFNWTGNVPFNNYASITLPAITFTPVASGNTLTVNLKNPNSGQVDGNLTNNTLTTSWDRPEGTLGTYTLTLKLDNYGSETSWDFKDANGTIVKSGGPYTDGNPALITETAALNNIECYTFTLHDSYGDGICCAFGNGNYDVKDGIGNTLITSNGQFQGADVTNWYNRAEVSVNEILDPSTISIYPNPNDGYFNIDFKGTNLNSATISVLQLDGKIVFESSTLQSSVSVDLSSLASGLYLVKVQTPQGLHIQKLTIR